MYIDKFASCDLAHHYMSTRCKTFFFCTNVLVCRSPTPVHPLHFFFNVILQSYEDNGLTLDKTPNGYLISNLKTLLDVDEIGKNYSFNN